MGEDRKQEVPQPSAPLCDFSVRIYEEWEPGAYRVQVTGNRTGRTASAETGRGIQWVFALLRALKEAGAYDERGAEGIQQAADELARLRAEVEQLREDNEKLRKESNSLRANRARLRRALLEHGSHDEDCHAHQHHDELAPAVSECDCGFSATLTPTGGDHAR